MKRYQYMCYSEGPLSQKNIKLTDEDKRHISVTLGILYRWRKDSDYMALQLTLKYAHQEEEFFSYGVVITYKVDGGAGLAAQIASGQRPDDLCKQILQSSVDFLRGALAVMVRNTTYSGLTLPAVDIDDLYKAANWDVR